MRLNRLAFSRMVGRLLLQLKELETVHNVKKILLP